MALSKKSADALVKAMIEGAPEMEGVVVHGTDQWGKPKTEILSGKPLAEMLGVPITIVRVRRCKP